MSTPMGVTTFRCPDCSQLLEFANKNEQLVFWPSSLLGDYRDLSSGISRPNVRPGDHRRRLLDTSIHRRRALSHLAAKGTANVARA
jgi:hypothetical protein